MDILISVAAPMYRSLHMGASLSGVMLPRLHAKVCSEQDRNVY